MDKIAGYFPELASDPEKWRQLKALDGLYREWNERINVISRKDIDSLYEKHVLHSLALYAHTKFHVGSTVLDIGTGGGFPGIPLAIVFPETHFHLVDSIGKKIKVVQAVADSLGLKNVSAYQARAEEVKDTFDYITSRAVAPCKELMSWTRNKMKKQPAFEGSNSWFFLKGGDLSMEKKEFIETFPGYEIDETPISQYYEGEFFDTKKILRIRSRKKN